MNVQDADSPLPEPSAEGAASAPAKRKRAPRKSAAAVQPPAHDAPADGGAPPALFNAPPSGDGPAPAPAERSPRPRRSRAAASAIGSVRAAGSGDQGDNSHGDDRHGSHDASQNAGDSDNSSDSGRQGEGGARASRDEAAAAGPADHSAAAPGAGEDAGEPGSRSARRNRNRRRGRRGGDKRADHPGAGPAEGRAGPATVVQAPAEAGELFAELLAGRFDAEVDAADGAETLTPSAFTPSEAAESDAATMADSVHAERGPDAEPASPAEGADLGMAPGADPTLAARRVLSPEPDAPKLHKVLAQSGAGSRRDLEQMITDSRVTVNGEVAHIGQRISYGDRIAIDGKPVRVRIAPPPARVLAYHKPAGEVVTHDDPQQRPTVFRRLPRLQQGKWQSVGRLDINTEGLLLFTNSGELANQLMHPRFGIEREYAVRSLGTLSPEAKARLLEGVDIEGQACAFKSIEDGGGEGVNHWYRCVITEGRNREVRKLFDTVGHAVSRLIRIRYGSVVLPRGLKRGVWVDLDERDLRTLRGLASQALPRPQPTERPPREADAGGREGRDGRGPRKRRGGRGKNDGAGLPAGAAAPSAGMDDDLPPGFIPDPLQTSLPGLLSKRARAQRAERPGRGGRGDTGILGGPGDDDRDMPDTADIGPIPNPLQQTFDKRAIQQERALKRELPEDAPIPNPLQQTYDKRALMRDRAPQRDIPDDGPIPNPLQQTYDKRFAGGGGGAGAGMGRAGKPGKTGRGGKPGKPAHAGNGLKSGPPGGGPRGKRAGPNGPQAGNGPGMLGAARGKPRSGPAKKSAGGGGREPDPMQTSVGYIGGDAFLRKGAGGRGPARSGGGGGGGGGQGPRGGGKGGPKGGPRGGGGGNRGGGPR